MHRADEGGTLLVQSLAAHFGVGVYMPWVHLCVGPMGRAQNPDRCLLGKQPCLYRFQNKRP